MPELLSPYFPYPPRPGTHAANQIFDAVDEQSPDMLETEAAHAVIEFEHQLYSNQLEHDGFPSATTYREEEAAAGRPLPQFETIWQQRENSTTLGVSFFMTNEGRETLRAATGVELDAETTEDCLQQLSSLDIRKLDSTTLNSLQNLSIGFEEERLTQAFLQSDFDELAVPEPQFLTIYKNPEVILEKANGYRQLKQHMTKVLSDLRAGTTGEDPQTTNAKILMTSLYRHRLNYFIAQTYVEAHKFAYQANMSDREDHQRLLDQLEDSLPAFSQSPTAQTADFLVRMDRYSNGVSVDEDGTFTWLSPEAKAQAELANHDFVSELVDRGAYANIDTGELATKDITGDTFGEMLRDVLREYGLLSDHVEWDSERKTPAPDGKWQIIVDGKFKSLAVDDKQRIMQVPAKPTTLLQAIAVGSHEITHVLQHHNKRLIGNLAILKRIGLDSVSDQAESGGLWQEKETRQELTGVTSQTINGTGYRKTLGAKAAGGSFGQGVKLFYEDLLQRDPTMDPRKAAARAVNRARRAYRSGGFEYARTLPVLTNSQPMSYLEQDLIYKNLAPERRKLLFIGGVSLVNLLRLSATGLIDLDQVVIPEKTPRELMLPAVERILSTNKS